MKARYIMTASWQFRENYGTHDWDGKGEAPQHWKNKGSHDAMLEVDLKAYACNMELMQDKFIMGEEAKWNQPNYTEITCPHFSIVKITTDYLDGWAKRISNLDEHDLSYGRSYIRYIFNNNELFKVVWPMLAEREEIIALDIPDRDY